MGKCGIMIRPISEIEYPPSDFLRTKASMLARMEALSSSTDSLMGVIAERLGAQDAQDLCKVEELTQQQDQLITNMRRLVQK